MIDLKLNPSRKDLRWFAGLQMVLFGFVAFSMLRRSGSWVAPACITGISSIIGIAGLLLPGKILRIYQGWMILFYPVAWVISHLAVGVVFYLVITPVGLVMRLFGYDPLQRRLDRTAESYWVKHETPADTSRYFRQF